MDLTAWQLFTDASAFVQGVMIVLLVVSFFAWVLIFARLWFFRWAKKQAVQFENQFWSGTEMSVLFEQLQARNTTSFGLTHIFQTGYKAFSNFAHLAEKNTEEVINSTRRAIDVAMAKEIQTTESSLSYFATVASVTPYVGLLGTVWGIMHSFISLSGKEQVTLAMVAPGIAEALVATAMGLIAAIPASIAYNYFVRSGEQLRQQYEAFREELLNILQRQLVCVRD